VEEGEEVVVVGGEEGLTRHHRRCGAPTPNRHRLIDDKIEPPRFRLLYRPTSLSLHDKSSVRVRLCVRAPTLQYSTSTGYSTVLYSATTADFRTLVLLIV
jgi:hypothetical protein